MRRNRKKSAEIDPLKEVDELDHIQAEVGKGAVATVGLVFIEFLKIIVLAGITIFLVRYFLFKPFIVKGESMEPNYSPKDYLIIDELSYRFREPDRGEVIVFRAPVGAKDFYLKRVLALPGERVKVEDEKVIVFNEDHPQGVVVEESYVFEPTPGSVSYNLTQEEYFVMGDNRDASFDSRKFGPITSNDIVGRTWLRGWPLQALTIFDTPTYNF